MFARCCSASCTSCRTQARGSARNGATLFILACPSLRGAPKIVVGLSTVSSPVGGGQPDFCPGRYWEAVSWVGEGPITYLIAVAVVRNVHGSRCDTSLRNKVPTTRPNVSRN